MTYLSKALELLKAAWPYISLIVAMFGGVHAGSADAQIPKGPEATISQQAERAGHVYGVGAVAAVAGVAGLVGLGANHGKLKVAPSEPPAGMSETLHRLGEAYAAMTADKTVPKEHQDSLNSIITALKVK